VTPLIWIHYSS